MADHGDWILKIISGPHQGVEELLPEGRLLVGTSPDCGIVLHDVLIAPQHFALTRKGATITVEALGGRTYCGGKRVTAPMAVPAFAFVTAGTTHVVLGPAGGTWPLLSSADAPELEKDPPSAPPAAAKPAPAPAASDAGKPAPTAAASAAPATPAAESTPAAPTPEQRRRAWWMVGFGGLLLVVWLVLWLLLRPAPTEPSRPGPRARTERVLGTLPGANQVRIEERGQQLAISGYVDSDATHRDLISALRAEVPEATLRLWSTPRIAETAREFLASRKLNLNVSPGGNGELTVSGTAPSAPEWTLARQLLLAEVPGLQRINDEVTVPKEQPKGAQAPAEPVVAPDQALTVIALQTAPEATAWVRIANGAVFFTGGSFQGVATFTGLEGGKARFAHEGGASLFGLGDNLAVLLNPRRVPEVPTRDEPASPPTPAATPNPPPAAPEPGQPPAPNPAPAVEATGPKTATAEPAPVAATQPAPAEASPAPATPAHPAPAEPGPAPTPPAAQPVTSSPAPGTDSSASAATDLPSDAKADESAPPPDVSEPSPATDSQAPVLAPEAGAAASSPAPAAEPVAATEGVTADAVPTTETPAPAPAGAQAGDPVAIPLPPATAHAPTALSPAVAPDTETRKASTFAPSAPAAATVKGAPPRAPSTEAAVAPTAAAAIPPPDSAPASPPAAALVRDTREAKILLIREALQAWEAGDLATGRRALLQLARLLQHGPAVPAQRDEMEPRTLAFQHEGFGPVP